MRHAPRRIPGAALLGLAALLAAPLGAAAPTWEEAADAGIAFQQAGEIHPGDDVTWPAFPEIMGGGACWADVDGDGYDDLYLVKQRYNEDNPAWGPWAGAEDVRNRLFLNDGDGTFTDATDGSGADSDAFGYGCSAADFDGDGCIDLFVSNFGPSELFHGRCDGTFADVTPALGRVGLEGACGAVACFSTSSSWADYDRDGDVDLFVANYVDSNLTDTLRGPTDHLGQLNFLLRNNGAGGFDEVAGAAGVAGRHTDDGGSKTLGVAWLDADLDGDLDLYVANDERPNEFYRNDGDGTFTDLSSESGLDNHHASMGVTAGDYDRDGYPDLFFTHYASEEHGFYRNNQDLTWEDRSGEDDLGVSRYVGWGTAFADIDRDGDPDIVATYGHTEWSTGDYDQAFQVWRNDPNLAQGADPWDRNWTDVTAESGAGMSAEKVHRGLGLADLEYDGDLDMATVQNGNQTAQLLEGDGVDHNWLYLRLRQPGLNRDAIGARVEVQAAGLAPQWRELQAGSSYLSQHSLVLDFGLGDATQADAVTVHWPGGGTTTLADLAAGQLLRIDRALGAAVNDTISPVTSAALAGTGQGGWWRSSVEATVAAADRGLTFTSGVASTLVGLDGSDLAPYAGPVAVVGEGRHVLRMRSDDAAGNAEPVRRVAVNIDLTPPAGDHAVAGTVGLNGWWVSPAEVTLRSLDALSGPGAIRYRVDDGPWTDYAAPFAVEDGVHTISYVVADAAGNEAPGAPFELRIDTTPPDVALTSPAPGALALAGVATLEGPAGGPAVVVTDGTAPFPVAADAVDATSGVAFVRFALDGRFLGADGAAPYTGAWDTAGSAEGLHLLEATATDAAGNAGRAWVRVVLASTAQGSIDRTVEDGPAVHLGDVLGLGSPLPPLALVLALPLAARRRVRP